MNFITFGYRIVNIGICILGLSFVSIAQTTITYETEVFECQFTGQENASFDCNFNGTLSVEIVGVPDQIMYIFGPIEVVEGEFTFSYQLFAVAPPSIELIWTIETSDDVIGCAPISSSVSSVINVNCECSPIVQVLPTTHESCYQCANGSAEALVSGMQEPIVYEWSNGETTPKIENLAPGAYSLTATGSNIEPCIAYYDVVIEPYECASAEIEYTSVHISCFDECDGMIDILGLTNGEDITDVLWSDGSTELQRNDLCENVYSVTVTTEDQCPYVLELTIEQPKPLELTITEIIHANGPETGSIDASADGGTGDFSYYISLNGVELEHDESLSIFENLEPGCYDISVIDEAGCISQLDGVCVENISAVEILNNTEFNVYPNPSNGYLFLDLDPNYEVESIFVQGITGNRLGIPFDKETLDLSQLSNGVYIIHIVTNKGFCLKQIVVNR